MPAVFMQSVIIPLVKAKGGDLTDVDNYRAIALSNSITTIPETVFLSKVTASTSMSIATNLVSKLATLLVFVQIL